MSAGGWRRSVYSLLKAMGGGEEVLLGDEGGATILLVTVPPQQGSHPWPVFGVSRFAAYDPIEERLLRVDTTPCGKREELKRGRVLHV